MIALITACGLLFVLAVTGWSLWFSQRAVFAAKLAAKQAEFDAFMKVGKWHQDRVAELEQETRVLASQIVAGGQVALRAMPIPGPADDAEYAYDETGLVRERLDPRDVPIS